MTITEPVSIAPLKTQMITQMSTAPSGLENGTTLHRPKNETDTSTGVYLVTIPTTSSIKDTVKSSRKAAGEVSDRTSISTSAKTFEKAHGEISDKTSTLRSTETFGRAVGK